MAQLGDTCKEAHAHTRQIRRARQGSTAVRAGVKHMDQAETAAIDKSRTASHLSELTADAGRELLRAHIHREDADRDRQSGDGIGDVDDACRRLARYFCALSPDQAPRTTHGHNATTHCQTKDTSGRQKPGPRHQPEMRPSDGAHERRR